MAVWRRKRGGGVNELRVDDAIHVRLDLESTDTKVVKRNEFPVFLII